MKDTVGEAGAPLALHGPRSSAEGGFTLVEILVVVAILGILAATVVTRFTGKTDEAKMASASTAVKSLGTALDVYHMDNGFYPSTEQGLLALVEKPTGDPEPSHWEKNGPYIKRETELKDPWGREFVYRVPGDHNPEYYDLSSLGPDGKDGTDDDVVNWRK